MQTLLKECYLEQLRGFHSLLAELVQVNRRRSISCCIDGLSFGALLQPAMLL